MAESGHFFLLQHTEMFLEQVESFLQQPSEFVQRAKQARPDITQPPTQVSGNGKGQPAHG